jgi:hypothetical protein
MNKPGERKRKNEINRMKRRASGIQERVYRDYLCKRCKEANWLVECLCGCGEIFTRRIYYRYSKNNALAVTGAREYIQGHSKMYTFSETLAGKMDFRRKLMKALSSDSTVFRKPSTCT